MIGIRVAELCKTVYTEGGTLYPTGLKIEAYYSNQTIELIVYSEETLHL